MKYSMEMQAIWIVVAVMVCICAWAGILMVKKMAKKLAHYRAQHPAVQPVKSIVAQTPVLAARQPAVNGKKPVRYEPREKPALKTTNGHHARSRRKVFNYAKFYTEMVLQGPAPVIGAETNGYDYEQSRMPSHVGPVEPPQPDATAVIGVHSELI